MTWALILHCQLQSYVTLALRDSVSPLNAAVYSAWGDCMGGDESIGERMPSASGEGDCPGVYLHPERVLPWLSTSCGI